MSRNWRLSHSKHPNPKARPRPDSGRYLLALILLPMVLSACSGSRDPAPESLEPMTGDSSGYEGVTPLSLNSSMWKIGDHLQVSSDRLRLRSTPETNDNNIIDVLTRDDEVVALKSAAPDSEFIYVSAPLLHKVGFVGRAYLSLSTTSIKSDPKASFEQKPASYFLVQNIATEKSRLYKKCEPQSANDQNQCQHQLILETENVIGGNTSETRTWLGSFKITHWFKFYEDSDGRYPAWYDPRYPSPPSATEPLSSWFDKKIMPQAASTHAEIRGAFGWFAAYLAPDVNAQWVHGTFGWGAQKKAPLQNTKSHGCTRFDNESVAYLRHLIRVGTPVLRIYAREADDLTTSESQNDETSGKPWSYILTRDHAQSERHDDPDRQNILRLGINKNRWMEEGTYIVQSQPNAVSGNAYQISDKEFRGRFLVNEGRVTADYQHPRSLEWGGYRDKLIPREMIKRNTKTQLESLR